MILSDQATESFDIEEAHIPRKLWMSKYEVGLSDGEIDFCSLAMKCILSKACRGKS